MGFDTSSKVSVIWHNHAVNRTSYLSVYISVLPHYPPSLGPVGLYWGKLLPHYGAFDKGTDRQKFFIKLGLMWGSIGGFDELGFPHYREFDIRLDQIPTMVPYNPEGR